jgi:hypothetical protein
MSASAVAISAGLSLGPFVNRVTRGAAPLLLAGATDA